MPEPIQISSEEAKKGFLRSYSAALLAISRYNQKQIENRFSDSEENHSLVAFYNEIRYATRHLLDAVREDYADSPSYTLWTPQFVSQMNDFWSDIQNGKNKLFEAVATESQNAAKRKKFERTLFWVGLIISYFFTPIITELLHDFMQFFIGWARF